MLNIECDKVVVNTTRETVFNFLSDLQNLKQLMPDSVSEFTGSADHCTFKISGMGTLGLQVKERLADKSAIQLTSYGKVPFEFTLRIHTEEQSANETLSWMSFEGDVNPFMRMMVEKPIGNFFGYLSHRLKKHYEG
jgi:carbon monoxide dehydrogenase subunit G